MCKRWNNVFIIFFSIQEMALSNTFQISYLNKKASWNIQTLSSSAGKFLVLGISYTFNFFLTRIKNIFHTFLIHFYESWRNPCSQWVQLYINLNSNNFNLPSKNSNQSVKSAKHSCSCFSRLKRSIQLFSFSACQKISPIFKQAVENGRMGRTSWNSKIKLWTAQKYWNKTKHFKKRQYLKM